MEEREQQVLHVGTHMLENRQAVFHLPGIPVPHISSRTVKNHD